MIVIDFILHVDEHLLYLIQQYGAGIYPLLFAILFVETGVVVFPFLPGDSLLFAAGALISASNGVLSLPWLLLVCILASIIGNSTNYWLGHKLGTPVLYSKKVGRFLKPQQVQKAEHFFEEKGKYTIFIGRFLPFIRTLIPFIAGSTKMPWRTFSFYNIISAICWVVLATCAGYFLGSVPVIHDHFSLIMLAVIFVSLLPMVITAWKNFRQQSAS